MNSFKKQTSYFKRKAKITAARWFEEPIYRFERRRIKKILDANENLILIYSIGKVGSSTVYESLKRTKGLDYPIFHLHVLNPERLVQQQRYYLSSERKSVPFHLVQSRALIELLPNYNGYLFIFTLVRDPIQRELSSIFQDSFNFSNDRNLNKNLNIEKVIMQKIQTLIKSLPENEWFDKELKTVFNFDVFNLDFDVQKGYGVWKKANTTLSLQRLENLNTTFSQVCMETLPAKLSYKIVVTNVGDEKFYYDAYKVFKKKLGLSKCQMDIILDTKFVQKFYPDFTRTISDRWQKEN